MNEKQAFDLAVQELELDGLVLRQISPGGVINLDLAQKVLPKAETWAAEALETALQGRLTYVSGADRWYVWNGRIHLPCDSDTIAFRFIIEYYKSVAEAMEHIKNYFQALGKAEEASGDKDGVKNAIKKYNSMYGDHKSFRDRLANTQAQRGVLAQLKVKVGVENDHYDNDRQWTVFRNGVFDSKATKEQGVPVVLPHSPERPVWRYIDAEYHPEKKANWLEYFLKTSLADETQAKFVQSFLGGVILGAPTKTKTVLDAFGESNSGKSMLNNILEIFLGDYYVEGADPAVIYRARDADRSRDDMRNARIITFLEVKGALDKGFLLKYAGGDTLETRALYRNNIKWKPQGGLMFLSNEGMNINLQEDAVADRIERVHYPHTFRKNSPDPRFEVREDLQQNILAEADGFVSWLVEGYMNYLANNVDGKPMPSESMSMLKMDMQEDENSFRSFWEKFDGTVYRQDLTAPDSKKAEWAGVYGKYIKWCQHTGQSIMSKTDAKAWAKRQGIVDRIGGRLRLVNRTYDDGHELFRFAD